MQYKPKPACTQGIVNVRDCLSLTNYFNLAYQSNLTNDPACNGNNDAAEFALLAKRALILCDTDENPSMFGMINMLFGYETDTQPEGINARQIFRKSQCRFNYSFQITEGVQANAPGAPVTITYAPQSHYLNGTATLGKQGVIITLPDRKTVQIISKQDTLAYGHTAVIQPYDVDYVIDLPANSFLLPTLARVDGDISCQQDGTTITIPGKIYSAYISKIRAEWCLEKVLNKGYDGIMQFAMGFIDGKAVECWEPLVVTEMRRAMRMTKDRMMFVGEKATNPVILNSIQSIQGFDGYLPSIEFGGGNLYPYLSLEGLDPKVDFANIFRFANANRRCKEYIMFLSRDFKSSLMENIYKWIGENPGQCTFQAFSRMSSTYGGTPESIVEWMSIDSLKVLQYTMHFVEVQEWSDPTMYGAPGYGFNTIGVVMPACRIPTSDGKSVAPIEVFYPFGCSDTGSYQEYYRDMEKINGCQNLEGHATEEFTVLFHCLEDHWLFEDASCD